MSDKTKSYEEKMIKTCSSLSSDYDAIRAGRANPRVLDRITVECYGTTMPLNQVCNIATPEPRIIQIVPYDISTLKAITKAIAGSDLGINPNSDGKVIRLVFPELSEERRKDLSKDVKKKGEAAKVAVRNIRRDAMDKFKKESKKSEITEDDLKDLEKEVQKLTDKYIENVDKLVAAKTKEIMAI
ncbi:MAG: ribosome recycling factor [Clostridiales bacterium]|nr:ribosome recycling factor [Clostridiales bacterium]